MTDPHDWYSTQVDWFRSQYYKSECPEENSLLQHNGWFGLTERHHPGASVFSNAIDRGGTIIDFGCGNGLLLRSLLKRTRHELIPFGVDFLAESIHEAQTMVLPQFKQNFSATNIAHFNFEGREYNYILICPAYLYPESAFRFLSKCLQHLAPGGKLILYEYCDVEIISHYKSLEARSGETVEGQFIGDRTTRLLCFDSPRSHG